MKTDGSILIDTKIIDGGMEKGFELIKDEMSSVGMSAKKVGEQIELSFSKMDVSKPIANAVARVQQLERQLEAVTADLENATAEGNDKSAERLLNKRISVYEQLEAAREKLSLEIAHAVQKEAEAEEKAAQQAQRAAERKAAAEKKEAAAKKRAQEKQLNDLTSPVMRFGSRLREIVSGALVFNLISAGLRKITSYFGAAIKSNTAFSESFMRLKGSLLTAFQPIYEVALPALLTLMRVLNSLVQTVGRFFAAITGKSTAQMAENAKALNKQADAIGGVGNAAAEARKQLAGFDEINRLDSADAAGGGGGLATMQPIFGGFNVNHYSEMIDRFIAPLQNLDFTALKSSLSELGNSFSSLGSIIEDSFAWIWFEILVPLSQWTIEELGPQAVDTLASAFGMLSEFLAPVVDGLKKFLEWVDPVVVFVEDTVVLAFQKCQEAFDNLAQVFHEKGPEISGIISNFGETIASIWEIIRPIMEKLRDLFSDVFSNIVELVGESIGKLIDIFYNLSQFIAGFISGDWQRAWDGLKNVVQNTVGLINDILFGLWNLVVEIVDGILQAIYDALVMVDRFLSGGRSPASANTQSTATYSMNRSAMRMPSVFAPQVSIPALAKGAVIPPNNRFLAVLGDQTSGTNIEAPLSTIQEAVRMEIGNQLNTTNELLQRILEKETDVILDGDKVGESVSNYWRRAVRARGY